MQVDGAEHGGAQYVNTGDVQLHVDAHYVRLSTLTLLGKTLLATIPIKPSL